MRVRESKKTIKRGTITSIYIRESVSDELLDWLNQQKYFGPAMLDIVDKYVKGELVNIKTLKNLGLAIDKVTSGSTHQQKGKGQIKPVYNSSEDLEAKGDSRDEEGRIINLETNETDSDNRLTEEQTMEVINSLALGEDDTMENVEDIPIYDSDSELVEDETVEDEVVGEKKKGQLSSKIGFSNNKPAKSIFKKD